VTIANRRGAAILVSVAALILLAAPAALAATWRVHPGASIQEAIKQAAPGDVIEIARGDYRENLRIEKPLTLRGVDRPTISGGQSGDTIRVVAPGVVIEGLIVRDSGGSLVEQNAGIYIQPGAHGAVIRRCDLVYNLFGLWIEKANDVVVEHNLIVGKRDFDSSQRGNGIQLYNTERARIVGNQISFVRDAIYVDVSHHALFRGNRLHHSRYGTHYMNSYHNVWEDNDVWMNRGGLALMEVRDQIVRRNRVWANSDHGIMLRTIQRARVEDNVVAGNARGFFIYDAQDNVLRGNLVVDNLVGVHLWAGSTPNEVEQNDFILNREPVRYVGARDEIWGARAGNYWSQYVGWDRDGDGVGDVPLEATDVIDRLSWRHPVLKVLLGSPAIQALRFAARQFPLLRAPSVVDGRPRMRPARTGWAVWRGKHFPGAREPQ
jgi:nitrous oxidase accessory protein